MQGPVLDCTAIDRQVDLYCSRDAAQHRASVGLPPKRAEVILAEGKRHGLLAERFGA